MSTTAALALALAILNSACGDSAPQPSGTDERGLTVPPVTEQIHCSLPIHPQTHRLANFALYARPGYPGARGPLRLVVAFALWDDGTMRWLSGLDPDGDRNEYLEARLSDAQRLELIQRVEAILADHPRPHTLYLDPQMHGRSAHLVAFSNGRGIALGRTMREAWTIDNLLVPPPREDAVAFVRLWRAVSAAFKATSDAAVGRKVAWQWADVSSVTRRVATFDGVDSHSPRVPATRR